MRNNTLAVGIAFLLALANQAAAQPKPLAFSALIPPSTASTDTLTIYVSTTGAPPPLSDLENKNKWSVTLVEAAGAREVTVDTVKWVPATAMVALAFPKASLPNIDLEKAGWQAVYLAHPVLVASFKVPAAGYFKSAKGKDDAIVYVLGSMLVGPSTKPIYVADVKFDLKNEVRRKGHYTGWQWALGLTGSSNTETKPPADKVSIDPDAWKAQIAFTKGIKIKSTALSGLNVSLAPVQSEFTRKTDVATGVAAASVQLVLPPAGTFGFYPQFGYEGGHTFVVPEKVSDQAIDLSEWNWISRVVAGASTTWTLFKKNATDDDWYHVTVTTAYSARFPFTREPFVTTGLVNGKRSPIVTFDDRTRRSAEAAIDWNALQYTSVTLKYKYGAQAPLFKTVDHQWVLGITVKAAKR